ANHDRGLVAWDATTGQVQPTGNKCQHPRIAISPDGSLLLVKGDLGSAEVWRLAPNEDRPGWQLADDVTEAVSGAGNRLVSASFHHFPFHVRVWDATTGRPLTPAVRIPSIAWLTLTPSGDRILIGSARFVQVLDSATGQPLTLECLAPTDIMDARFAA